MKMRTSCPSKDALPKASIDDDLALTHDRAITLGVAVEQGAELRRSHRRRFGTEGSKLLAHGGLREDLVDLGVETIDDRLRRARRSVDAVRRAGVKVLQ